MEIQALAEMGNPMRNRSGQALVEAAMALPCILLLLTGLLVAGRAVSLAGSAESAVFTQVLREGRRQPSIWDGIAKSILVSGRGASTRTERKKVSNLIPSILPSPEGRTRSSVRVDKDWEEAGRIASWPTLSAERWIEASVDCWDRQTPSGRKTAAAVRAYILVRAIR